MVPRRTWLLIWTRTVFAAMTIVCTSAMVSGQRSDARQGPHESDAAFEALKAELEEAQRVWLQKYRQATTDGERANLDSNSPLREVVDPPFSIAPRLRVGGRKKAPVRPRHNLHVKRVNRAVSM